MHTTAVTWPESGADALRRGQLRVTKRRATALLAAVTVVFVVATVAGSDAGWVGYVQATAAASMVGGLADWFAVVALFRHPLGVPIPHTAIVVERKDQFAATLGDFIQGSFLTPQTVVERLRGAQVVPRTATWLAAPANADRVAAELLQGLVTVSALLRDDDVHRVIEALVRQRADAVAAAPLAGRALRAATAGGRHEELVDRALKALQRWVATNEEALRRLLAGRATTWLRGVVEQRVFDRVVEGLTRLLAEMARDRHHLLRRELTTRLVTFADQLEHSPELRLRGEQLKRDLLDRPEVAAWVAEVWLDLKGQFQKAAEDPASDLRGHLASAVASTGSRLREDPSLGARVEQVVESLVVQAVEHSQGSIAGLVSTVIARWDAEETASRLELLLGPDLQWVRINGTVVGAAAGLVLHAASQALA